MAKHRPQSPTRGRWLVLQMLQPKAHMGLAGSKPAIAMGWVGVGGQRAGGWAHKQVTGSLTVGIDLGIGLAAAGSWKGRFCLGKWQSLSHVAPTRITMLITAGMGGLHKDTQERGEKKYNLKEPKPPRAPACLVERQAGYEQMF